MLKFLIKTLGIIAALSLSCAAGAVGMGGINVITALGEPLNAEIDLLAISKADKNKLSARLASPETYKAAGLDFPAGLPQLKFQIEARANGEPRLRVTTAQPVNEPFVSLLVELSWSSGKLLREYTFLLDPPGFKPIQPKTVEVQPLAPSTVSPEDSANADIKPVVPAPESQPAQPAASIDEKISAGGTDSVKQPAEGLSAPTTVTVKQGDTLSKIARETKVPDISLERMLVAMYRANEDAFDGKNMNRLKSGKILHIPVADDLNNLAQVEAVKEINAQAADWHAYRLKLAAASGSVAEQAPKQEVSGKISSKVADKTPSAPESSKEVVRLSKGEAPGDKAAVGGSAKSLQDKAHAKEEEAIAKAKALKENNERVALLEKNVKDMQRLVELKAQAIPAAPAKAESAVQPQTKPEVMTETASAVAKTPAPAALPASAVKPVKPVAPKVVVPEPSLLDEILSEPLYLAGGAASLLGLGGLGFMLTRRRRSADKEEIIANEAVASTHIAAPVAPSPETGDFTQLATSTHNFGAAGLDDVDPISEADLFLNFGRDKQAEEILKDALNKNPGNQKIRLKLLSIYANRKDVKTFASVARQVEESGDAAAWAQAAEMGRRLDPGNPMYGANDGSVAVTESATPVEGEVGHVAPSLDFDLGFGEPVAGATAAAMDVPLEAATHVPPEGLDFDLGFAGAAELTSPASDLDRTITFSEQQSGKQNTSSGLDFDLGDNVSAKAVASDSATGDSRSSINHGAQNAEENTRSGTLASSVIDFDITGDHAETAVKANEKADNHTAKKEDLVFDVSSADFSPATMMDEMAEADSSAKLDDPISFSLDFPAEEPRKGDNLHSGQVSAKEAGNIDLSEINLNVGAQAVAPDEKVKDAHWHDVATKLDLARAYQEMGDASGAREILEEVYNEGDASQRAAAKAMLEQLSA